MNNEKLNIRPCNKAMCETCIFRDNQKVITNGRLTEIKTYLIRGTPHVCHKTNKHCYGGRDFQAKIFHSMGIISEPTAECLNKSISKFNNENNIAILQ